MSSCRVWIVWSTPVVGRWSFLSRRSTGRGMSENMHDDESSNCPRAITIKLACNQQLMTVLSVQLTSEARADNSERIMDIPAGERLAFQLTTEMCSGGPQHLECFLCCSLAGQRAPVRFVGERIHLLALATHKSLTSFSLLFSLSTSCTFF